MKIKLDTFTFNREGIVVVSIFFFKRERERERYESILSGELSTPFFSDLESSCYKRRDFVNMLIC